jgi:hypothetical protein
MIEIKIKQKGGSADTFLKTLKEKLGIKVSVEELLPYLKAYPDNKIDFYEFDAVLVSKRQYEEMEDKSKVIDELKRIVK